MMTRIVAVLAGLFLLSAPALAQECFTLDDVKGVLDKEGTPYVLLSLDKIPAFVDEIAEPVLGVEQIDGVTNVIVANLHGGIVFGLEIDGCVVGPVQIPGVSTLPGKMSGKMPDGSIHA